MAFTDPVCLSIGQSKATLFNSSFWLLWITLLWVLFGSRDEHTLGGNWKLLFHFQSRHFLNQAVGQLGSLWLGAVHNAWLCVVAACDYSLKLFQGINWGSSYKMSILGQSDSTTGKGACCHAWRPSSIPRAVWWKERDDSCRLSSDLKMYSCVLCHISKIRTAPIGGSCL